MDAQTHWDNIYGKKAAHQTVNRCPNRRGIAAARRRDRTCTQTRECERRVTQDIDGAFCFSDMYTHLSFEPIQPSFGRFLCQCLADGCGQWMISCSTNFRRRRVASELLLWPATENMQLLPTFFEWGRSEDELPGNCKRRFSAVFP
jgi:hypothetical protein